jgi:hypothetical protein
VQQSGANWDLPERQWSRLERLVPFAHGYPKDWMDIAFPANIRGEELPSRWKERLP